MTISCPETKKAGRQSDKLCCPASEIMAASAVLVPPSSGGAYD
jgi:hypothetical protein